MPFPGSSTQAWVLQLDPSAVADADRVMLDINNPSTGIQIAPPGPDWGTADIQEYLAQQGQYGSAVIDWILPNRTVTIPLGLGVAQGGPDANAALDQLQAKVGLLQREGGWLVRQRDGGQAMYADIVKASLQAPDNWAETAGVEPGVTLVLECLPDFYGDEISLDVIACTGVCHAVLKQSTVQAVIGGDHGARCRIIATDASGNNQDGVLWAVRSRHYDPASTAALFYEAEALTPLDAAAVFNHAGASGGKTMRHNSLPGGSWCPVLETDLLAGSALTHQGSYEVWARVYSATAVPQLRLVWGVGDVAHPVTNPAVAVTGAGAFYPVSLGTVRLDRPPAGNYAWHGVIQALAASTNDPVEIDCVYLVPLDESAGQLSAVQSASPILPAPNQSFITGANVPDGVAVDGTYIYWANQRGDTIGRANLDGSGVNRFFIIGATDPVGVAVDSAHVYWTNFTANTIGRANLDGSGVNQSFITGANQPRGIAVDAAHIYWTNPGTDTIGRANLDGSSPNQSFITGAAPPFGIAVDAAHIYWTNFGGANTIGRANLDGTSPNQSFITGANGPTGVAVDGTYIYWTNYGTNTIGRALLNGTSPNQSFITGANGPNGVAVDGTYIYWANNGNNTIGRLAKTALIGGGDAVIFANRQAELRSEGMYRQDSTGTVEGTIAKVLGDLPRLPASGTEDRAVELFLKPTQGDLATLADSGLDAFTAQVKYRPCYLFRP